MAVGAVSEDREHGRSLQILGDCLEISSDRGSVSTHQCIVEAMIDMILDQRAFGLLHRLLHGMKLLCDVHAGLFVLNHLDDAGQVPVGTFQPLDDGGVTCMSRMFCHMSYVTP